jgi:Domain of unknown function (DUF4157)
MEKQFEISKQREHLSAQRAKKNAREEQPAVQKPAEPEIAAVPEHPILRMQRLYGNRFVQRAIEGGSELPAEVRRGMERAFHADFSGVRIHTDAEADSLSRSLGARAFTTGGDIFFRHGEYAPAGEPGQELLAHELAHVVQQASAQAPETLTVSEPGDASELAAEAAARAVVEGIRQPAPAAVKPAAIQRDVAMKGDVIEVTPREVEIARLKLGEAEQAVMKYIEDFLQKTTIQGRLLGFAHFEVWYRGYRKAREMANHGMAEAICKFVLSEGLKFVFSEEEEFIKFLREKAEWAYEKAVVVLDRPAEANIEDFLAEIKLAEQEAFTAMLGAPREFRAAHPQDIEQAIIEFASARDAGWQSATELPDSVKAILARVGVGDPTTDVPAVQFAEGWLTAHISFVLSKDTSFAAGAGPLPLDVFAQISALRQRDAFANRERIYELERSLSPFFRSISNINEEIAAILHIRLGISQDKADAIEASRRKQGPFESTEELVSRGILTRSEYDSIKHLVVAV